MEAISIFNLQNRSSPTLYLDNQLTHSSNKSKPVRFHLGTVDMNPGDHIEVYLQKATTPNEEF
jgi:hypothetical protein